MWKSLGDGQITERGYEECEECDRCVQGGCVIIE